MSKSFNISFEQSFKVTLADDVISEIRAHLQKEAVALEQRKETLTSSELARSQAALSMAAKDDDEFLTFFLKTAFRDGFRDEFIREVTSEKALQASKFAPATVKVTPRG